MERLGPYVIVKRLGAGAMGEVWLADHELLRTKRAIKVLPPALAASGGFRRRFIAEGQVLAALRHPNIVQIHDMGIVDDTHYIAMDFVSPDGEDSHSLQDLLASRGGRLPVEEASSILHQVIDAVSYAHSQHVIHRDIKPTNVLVDSGGQVRVSDFGLALVVGNDFVQQSVAASLSAGRKPSPAQSVGLLPSMAAEESSTSSSLVGTFHFMPPEVQNGGEWTEQGDVYSLGVLAYVLVTGRRPLGRWRNPSEIVPDLPKGWDFLVGKALEEEPERRYASVVELRHDLANVDSLTEGGGLARHARAAGGKTTRRVMAALLLIAGLAVAAGGWFSMENPDAVRRLLAALPEGMSLPGMAQSATAPTASTTPPDPPPPRLEKSEPANVALGSALETTAAALLTTVVVDSESSSPQQAVALGPDLPPNPSAAETTAVASADAIQPPQPAAQEPAAMLPTPEPTPAGPRAIRVARDGTGEFTNVADAVAAAREGDTVRLEPGLYREPPITLAPGVHLVGSSASGCRIEALRSGAPLVTVGSGSEAEIANITFDGRNMASPGILLHDASAGIRDCAFSGFGGDDGVCLMVTGADAAPSIMGSQFTGGRIACLAFRDGARGSAENNTFTGSRGSGIEVAGSGTAPTLMRNQCRENQEYGIVFRAGAGGTAEQNTCERNFQSGIAVLDPSTAPDLISNKCLSNVAEGILFANGAGGTATRNTCTGNSASGIRITDNGSAPRLTLNICAENGSHGISYADGAAGEAHNNTCEKNQAGGIHVAGKGTVAMLAANSAMGNSGVGIHFADGASGSATGNKSTENGKGCYEADDGSSPKLEANTCEHQEKPHGTTYAKEQKKIADEKRLAEEKAEKKRQADRRREEQRVQTQRQQAAYEQQLREQEAQRAAMQQQAIQILGGVVGEAIRRR